jgi:hypothetical protein
MEWRVKMHSGRQCSEFPVKNKAQESYKF